MEVSQAFGLRGQLAQGIPDPNVPGRPVLAKAPLSMAFPMVCFEEVCYWLWFCHDLSRDTLVFRAIVSRKKYIQSSGDSNAAS